VRLIFYEIRLTIYYKKVQNQTFYIQIEFNQVENVGLIKA